MKIQNLLGGNNRDFLVRKFTEKLINKVREKKDKEIQKTNEHHVKKIINKLDYN